MKRGDFVTVALQGDFGKPRPALIVQSDLLAELGSVIVCPVTSELRDVAFRVLVEPTPGTGLQVSSQVMVDKLATVPRAKLGPTFGRLDEDRMKAVERTLLLVLGMA